MSDNIDPNNIKDLNDNLKALLETMSSAGVKTTKAGQSLGELAGFTKKTNDVFGALTKTAGTLGKSMYEGKQASETFGTGLSNAITTIELALGPLGLVAKVAFMALGALAKGFTAATKQGESLYKSYQDLAKSGATASDGITGVFNNMQKFGYGIEELDKMVKLVSENSQTLAKFSLTAADGTSAFAGAMQGLTRDQGLKVLGKMPDEINAAGAAYIKQQVAVGRNQKDVGDNLGVSTKQYIMDLDRLQRLTGTSADQLQKQQDEAMSEDAYNDVMADLKARADAGDANATAQIKKITTTMASLSPEMQKEFQKSIGGDLSAQQKLMMRMPSLMRNVTDESVSIGQTMNEAKSDITTYVDTMGKSYRLNSEGMREYGGTLRSAREEITQFSDWEEREKAADKNAKVHDKATENLAKMDLERMNSRDALQSFVQLGVAPATRAMAALAKGTSTAASLLPGAGPAGQNSVAGKLDAMNAAGAKPMVPSGAGAAPAGEAKPVSPGPKGKEQQAYYDKMYDSLLKEAKAAGLKNAEVVAKLGAAQTSLETGYGKHMVGNNAFGIKAKQGGASVGASTQEFENGRMVTKNQNFRAYDKPEDSAKDYIKFLQENKRYKDVLGSNNLSDAIAAQGKTGYATDPNYANKLAGIAGTYGNTSGPLNGYQSQTAGLNPSKTLPEKTDATQTAANLATAGDDKHADLLSQILGSLDNLNHSNQQIASSTKKSVQLQS